MFTSHELEKTKGKISLGLCCINNTLRKKDIFCSRSMIRKNFTVDKAQDYALKNINDIYKLVDWNSKNNIDHLRLSSEIFPHFTDTETESYSLDFAKEELKKVGDYCKDKKHRITMHPGQYNQIGAKDSHVFEQTIKDLKMHADIIDYMGMGSDSIICIHGGGIYGDKEKTMRRWIEQFDDLPSNVKKRIAIENCEKCYSTRDCIHLAQETKIPMILDSHHYDCYNLLHPNETIETVDEMMDEIIETWDSKTPLFHISEQAVSKRVGAHSDYIDKIPDYMLRIPYDYDTKISIEVEAKAKEAAIKKLQESYKTLF